MRFAFGLILVGVCSANFFMKISKEEKCIVDSFIKNQEAIIKLEVSEASGDRQFDFKITIKDIGLGYVEVQNFVFKNDKKRSFVYTHLATGEAAVCFTSNVDLLVNIKLDVTVAIPENLIDKNDMQELENTIYQSVTAMADFNRKQKDLGKSSADSLNVN